MALELSREKAGEQGALFVAQFGECEPQNAAAFRSIAVYCVVGDAVSECLVQSVLFVFDFETLSKMLCCKVFEVIERHACFRGTHVGSLLARMSDTQSVQSRCVFGSILVQACGE